MANPESRIEASIRRNLWTRGAIAIKLTGWEGMPDRVVVFVDPNGVPRFYFIEVKTRTGRLSAAQKSISKILPGAIYICRSVTDALNAHAAEIAKYA